MGFLNMSKVYETPAERLIHVLETLKDIFDTYGSKAAGFDVTEWNMYFDCDHFSISKTLASSSTSIIKFSGSESKKPADSLMLSELVRMNRAEVFLQYVVPEFNALNDQTRMLILSSKYMYPLYRTWVQNKIGIHKSQYYDKWIYKAQNEMIMQLQLDFYGWQQDDEKGEILPLSTISNRRHLAQAHPKYYLRKK